MSRVVIIEPGASARDYWHDLWEYRELFAFLAWRDISVRYRQTVIGITWSLIQPIMTMIVFTVVFGRLANLPTGGAPYPILVFAALLPWQFFATGLTQASTSLISNANMISKIYFPRVALPVSSIVVCFVDLLLAFAVLLVLMVGYGLWPTWRFVALVPLTVLAAMFALGAGLWCAALNVRYRDFRYLVPFLLQFGLFVSPVGFSSSIVPPDLALLYSLNPLVGVIDGFRWAILGQDAPIYLPGFALSIFIVTLVLVTGFRYFRSVERTFADVI
ncbi:MAG: ABC transporter permease [Candidatus Limnocylindrales bacterium]